MRPASMGSRPSTTAPRAGAVAVFGEAAVAMLALTCALVGGCRDGESSKGASLGAGSGSQSSREPRGAEVTGTMQVAGAPVALTRCRPGHAVHVFVEVDTSAGTLRFGEGKLWWLGSERRCARLDRRWGGGVRRDGSTYFRGTLSFACGDLTGDLALDCGGITPAESTELARNARDARARAAAGNGDTGSGDTGSGDSGGSNGLGSGGSGGSGAGDRNGGQ